MSASVSHAAALADVRAMCARLSAPTWFSDPQDWRWRKPDGTVQGLHLVVEHTPGLANLLWLALDLDLPPPAYDGATNLLFMSVLTTSVASRLNGQPLLDLASVKTLQEFHDMLPTQIQGHNLERHYPALKALARRRLDHANT